MTTVLEIIFWFSLAALVWTHLAYPLVAWRVGEASPVADRRVRHPANGQPDHPGL